MSICSELVLTTSKLKNSLYNVTFVSDVCGLHGNIASMPSLTIMRLLLGAASRCPVSKWTKSTQQKGNNKYYTILSSGVNLIITTQEVNYNMFQWT